MKGSFSLQRNGQSSLMLRITWLCCLLFALSASASSTTPADTFTLLTYNVRGLPPAVTEDDPVARLTAIANHLDDGAYALVLLQEVFAFHELFGGQDKPLERYAGPDGQVTARNLLAVAITKIPCWFSEYCQMPANSGVQSLVFDSEIPSDLLLAQAYTDCHGVWRAANDCLAGKGFVAIRLTVFGQEIHVYNTHLDAGRGEPDREARRQQLAELAAAIDAHSRGVHLIVAGDLNLRLLDPDDQRAFTEFLMATGLEDSGIHEQHPHPDDYHQLDYVLFKSGESGVLRVISGGEAEEFRTPDDKPLSDHPPLFVTFAVASG